MKKQRKLKKKEDKFMKIEKYFGNYECNNFNKVVEYMTNLNENLKNVYSKEWEYSNKIADFIQNNLKYDINSNEVTYLTLHISPMLKDATDK